MQANSLYKILEPCQHISEPIKWKPLTLPELKIFLGLTLITGLLDERGHL